jgi:hypothetical protein
MNPKAKYADWRLLSRACLIFASILLVAIVVVTFGPLPKYILSHSIRLRLLGAQQLVQDESDIRGSLLQGVGGVLLVAGAITAWRQMLISRGQHALDRQVAVTEAFAKAIEFIGNDRAVDVRLGGIYSLDRVADDDPNERARILDILLSFIRDNSPGDGDIPRDVRAALTVLTRRSWPKPIDLSEAKLTSVDLRHAYFVNANLSRADLSMANLSHAILQGANLRGADLRRSDLGDADLRGAQLISARLSGARADSSTRWPEGYDPAEHGVLF